MAEEEKNANEAKIGEQISYNNDYDTETVITSFVNPGKEGMATLNQILQKLQEKYPNGQRILKDDLKNEILKEIAEHKELAGLLGTITKTVYDYETKETTKGSLWWKNKKEEKIKIGSHQETSTGRRGLALGLINSITDSVWSGQTAIIDSRSAYDSRGVTSGQFKWLVHNLNVELERKSGIAQPQEYREILQQDVQKYEEQGEKFIEGRIGNQFKKYLQQSEELSAKPRKIQAEVQQPVSQAQAEVGAEEQKKEAPVVEQPQVQQSQSIQQAETPQPAPQAEQKAKTEVDEKAKTEQERATQEQTIASDFKKLYGVDYTPENVDKLNKEGKLFTLNEAEKILTAKDAPKNLKGYSTEDLAKLQLTIRQAEFDSKNKAEPDKAIADRRQRIIENKDKMNDAILDKMERYASGTKKIQGEKYEDYKLNKDSFNMLHRNAPEELQKYCKGTLSKAFKKVNSVKGAVSAERLDHAMAQKLKYKDMEIKDTDGLWTMAKKAAKMKTFNASRTAKKKIKKWWRKGKIGKFVRAIPNNKLTRGISLFSRKITNKAKLFPSRAKNAIGKFWMNKIVGPIKNAWNKHVAEPFKNKVYMPVKNFVNDKIVEPVKQGIQWVKDNPKKAMAGAFMAASIGLGATISGPAGAWAGAKVGGMILGGATVGYGAYKGTQLLTNKTKQGLKNSFQKNQAELLKEKTNEDKTKAPEVEYTEGRQAFNQHSEEMKVLLNNYKKSITPEGNEGKPLTEKEAAVKMYQSMTADKNKGGLGLSEETAQSIITYFNGNKTISSTLTEIKDEINKPIVEEKSSVNPGKEQEKPEIKQDSKKTEETKAEEQESKTPPTQGSEKVLENQPQPTAKVVTMDVKKQTKALIREDFKKLKDNPEFGEMLAYCQVNSKSGQYKQRVADVAKKIEKMMTTNKEEGGLGLDAEKDAKRIANLKTYLYKQGVKTESFDPKTRKEQQANKAEEKSLTPNDKEKVAVTKALNEKNSKTAG